MVVDARPVLVKALEESEGMLEAAVARLLSARDDVVRLRTDVEHLRGTIELLSRGNGHPYIASPVTTAADFLLELGNGQKVVGQMKQPAAPTKSGEVAKGILENPGLKTRQVFDKIQDKKPPVKITIMDMHRIIPRLVEQGRVRRDPQGLLWPVSK